MNKLLLDKEARELLLQGVQKLRDGVASTLGACGSTAIIGSNKFVKGYTVTKDGVTVAKDINSDDDIENIAIKILREAAEKTAKNAGDGTTSTIIMAAKMIEKGTELINEKVNKFEVLREIDNIINEKIIPYIEKQAEPIDERKIKEIACISCNSDKNTADIVAEAFINKGYNQKTVTKEKSKTEKTYCDVIEGVSIDKGYIHSMFANNEVDRLYEANNCKLLISDVMIDNTMQIISVLEDIQKNNESLLIISECADDVLGTILRTKIVNNLKVCIINPPMRGWKRTLLLKDIASLTGGTYIGETTIDINDVEYEHLGTSPRVKINNESTVIFKNENVKVADEVLDIKDMIDKAENIERREFNQKRLSFYIGGIGVVYVGGETDIEYKELNDRVDDAIRAVSSSIDGGIVAGGGTVFKDYVNSYTGDSNISWEIVKEMIIAPYKTIIKNAMLEYSNVDMIGYGINVASRKEEDFKAVGIIDPAKVLIETIKNAVSVAKAILSTNAVVINEQLNSAPQITNMRDLG
jgi:chaperonin GroEL